MYKLFSLESQKKNPKKNVFNNEMSEEKKIL